MPSVRPLAAGAALAVAVAAVVCSPAPARAACVTDLDCPGAACGGQVCDWSSGTLACAPAGSKESQGADGECATNADCKCAAEGAVCRAPFCSFTLPPDAGAGGTAGTAGASGATGGPSAGGGSGGCGCLIAGAPFTRPDDGGLWLLGAALASQAARRRRRAHS